MKKYLIGAAGLGALALSFGLSATPALALNISDYCKANGDFGVSHGECVGQLINGQIPKLCRDFLEADPVAFEAAYGKANVGACVSAVRKALKDL
jgi:hypothetical protein